jgi:hypothetical protein
MSKSPLIPYTVWDQSKALSQQDFHLASSLTFPLKLSELK